MKWQEELTRDEMITRAAKAFSENVDEILDMTGTMSFTDLTDAINDCQAVVDDAMKYLKRHTTQEEMGELIF